MSLFTSTGLLRSQDLFYHGKTRYRFVRERDAIITRRQARADSFSRRNDGWQRLTSARCRRRLFDGRLRPKRHETSEDLRNNAPRSWFTLLRVRLWRPVVGFVCRPIAARITRLRIPWNVEFPWVWCHWRPCFQLKNNIVKHPVPKSLSPLSHRRPSAWRLRIPWVAGERARVTYCRAPSVLGIVSPLPLLCDAVVLTNIIVEGGWSACGRQQLLIVRAHKWHYNTNTSRRVLHAATLSPIGLFLVFVLLCCVVRYWLACQVIYRWFHIRGILLPPLNIITCMEMLLFWLGSR